MTSPRKNLSKALIGRRKGKKHLSPEARAAIVAAYLEGTAIKDLADRFKCHRNTVTNTIKRYRETGKFNDRAHIGAKPKITAIRGRLIVRIVRKLPRICVKALLNEIQNRTGVSIHRKTLVRFLKQQNLYHWKSLRRNFLSPKSVIERNRLHRYWRKKEQELTEGYYSDECSVASDTSNPSGWVWRYPGERYDRRMVNITDHGRPDVTLMVYGFIYKGGRSELIIMERDAGSARKGYTSDSYIQALEKALLPVYQSGKFYQQDNAKIHKSKKTMEWFEAHGIRLIEWPAHSPDMNPIEHVWKHMKAILHRRHPNVHELKNNAEDRATLAEWIKEAWWAVPQSLIDHLIDGMPKRIRALRRAKGWYTKY